MAVEEALHQKHEELSRLLVDWFLDHRERAEVRTPRCDGEWLMQPIGDVQAELRCAFDSDAVPGAVVEGAADRILSEIGTCWLPCEDIELLFG
jgi:hypothetical protein